MYYHFDKNTKEFIGASEEFAENVSTETEPKGVLAEYEIYVYDIKSKTWNIEKDYRTANTFGVVYDKNTGETIDVTDIGEIEGTTPKPPVQYDDRYQYVSYNNESHKWNKPKSKFIGETAYNKKTLEKIILEDDITDDYTLIEPYPDAMWSEEQQSWINSIELDNKLNKRNLLNSLIITFKKTEFQGNLKSQTSMANKLVVMETKEIVNWKSLDNTLVPLSKADLKKLLKLSIDESQKIFEDLI